MIRRVALSGWKAFDALTFEPGPDVTFVVARNGVGKTSLLDGISWGIFGDRSGIDSAAMIRAGHSTSKVTVELDGPGDLALRIERAVNEPALARLGERELQVDELDQALREVFGANLDFAARATTLGHSTLVDQARSFEHLDTHLADVFGISHLREATEAIEARFGQLKNANQKLRAAARAMPDLKDLRSRQDEFRTELSELVERRPAVQAEFDKASESVRALTTARHAAAELTTWREAHAAVTARVNEAVGGDGDNIDRLTLAIDEHEREVSELTLSIGAADAVVTAANASLASLEEPGAICPTCRRPLSDHERMTAQHDHTDAISVATENAAAAHDRLDRATNSLRRLRELLREVERLGLPPVEVPIESTDDDVLADLERARTDLGEIERQIGECQGALAEIERSLEGAEAQARADAERHAAIRQEAVAQLTASVMRSTVTELMERRIGPITDAVSARWKQVFGDRGTLRISPQGEITMERSGHTIAFRSFSPGEQVVSMLALRFLTVAASTTSPFMLLDEPLECLDPPNRRLIASVLVGADRPVRQMIVTTYEESLVRRIHATVPDADVRVIG
jgi:DNA repair exonuclease SbcCD ATPase subunit